VSPQRLQRLRLFFGITQRVSPGLAARAAFHLFLRTFRHPLRPEDAAALARARRLSIPVRGHAITAFQWGDTGPLAVILHGWGSSSARFTMMAEALHARGWRVVVPDAPGHGASAGSTSSLPEFMASLEAIAGHCGSPQALVGHSLGALAIACCHRNGPPPWAGELRKVVLIAMPDGAEYLLGKYIELLRLSAATERALRRQFHGRFAADPADYASMPGAGNIAADLLLVHDRGDDIVPFGHSADLAARLPRAGFIATEGGGHSALTRDAATLARIVDFIG
jgi:pimeloyl-ACP methyl ester carboxylesterase